MSVFSRLSSFFTQPLVLPLWKPSRPALMGFVYLLILSAPWAVWQVDSWSQSRAFERLARQGRERVILYAGSLHSEIEKYQNIPQVLASDPEVTALLSAGDRGKAQALSRRLERLNHKLGASAIYVLNEGGMTLSASNWAEGVGSFVGQRFDFRPYFVEARQGRVGRYFALGSTSNQPGYYIAMPVMLADRVAGAVVVKMALDELEKSWTGTGEKVFVTDAHGIVFITNNPGWRYRSRWPLRPDERLAVRTSRQYGDESLDTLNFVSGERLVTADGRGYLSVAAPLEDGQNWTLTVLLDARDAQSQARITGLLAVAAMTLLGVGLYYLAHRTLERRRQTRELERRVAERTAALTESNQRLQDEIIERRRAEEELTNKQAELVQAAKLAALGQMSAGMVHEINQPLAALRSYADNAVTYLDLERPQGTRENLHEIVGLTERMARITGQLKHFARKSTGAAAPIEVAAMVEGSLALLGGRLRTDVVTLVWSPPNADLRVWGDEVRLQQVLVNLLRNGLDAMKGRERRRLEVRAEAQGSLVHILVRDNGTGISDEGMVQLFDPFFTTKPAGEGLGLGLSISEGIVRDLGGRLSAANIPEGGAQFTVTLRKVEEPA
ncbi:MAG TPA: ATP-binding protein [Candidatus Sulfotelmatobacter sp.]|nr:ATP-binding protein [Candidatus Sulfotelmatobacter sp.]